MSDEPKCCDTECKKSCVVKQIEQEYDNFKLNAEKFDVFDINQGIKQGEVLSPALFNFFINDLIEKC